MRRLFSLLAALAFPLVLPAQQIRDVDVTVDLFSDGSARITQVWDATVVQGTEWYIPIENLGRMTVTDLTVSENGQEFISEGRHWNVDRSLSQKAGRCGIVEKRDGVELCWGQGSYGDHVWTASFTVTGLVQSLQDADAFNFMFVNPELVAPPQHARVTIRNATGGPQWTYDNTRVWGFGFIGDINVKDGQVIAESSEPFGPLSQLIAMVRFEKGLFSPAVSRDMSFDEMKSTALEGSYDSHYGRIESAWTAEKGVMTSYRCTVPANTTATLYLPVNAKGENGNGATCKGSAVRNGLDTVVYELTSGTYQFRIRDGRVYCE